VQLLRLAPKEKTNALKNSHFSWRVVGTGKQILFVKTITFQVECISLISCNLISGTYLYV